MYTVIAGMQTPMGEKRRILQAAGIGGLYLGSYTDWIRLFGTKSKVVTNKSSSRMQQKSGWAHQRFKVPPFMNFLPPRLSSPGILQKSHV